MPGVSFGEVLRRLRRDAGLNLADLADAAGFSIAHMSDIERGRKNPPDEATIRKLLARVGHLQKLPEMLVLAAKARRSVEISVEGKEDNVACMLVALERRCNEGNLDNDLVEKIRRLLEKGNS